MRLDGLLIAGLLVAAAGAQESSAPGGAQALTGHWRFNADKSEDARQKVHDAMASRHQGGSGGSGGGMGGHHGGGGMGRHGGGYGGAGSQGGTDPRQAMRPLFDPPAELTITPAQGDSEIAMVEQDGRVRTLHPDGKKYKASDGSSETTTRWDNGQLIVETKAESGPRLTEAFSAAPEGHQLNVLVSVDSSRMGSVSVRRVYDAVDAGQ